MKILITNISMAGLSGTEHYTRTLAQALVARGHIVTVYAPRSNRPDQVANPAEVRIVHSVDELEAQPDILHCHHFPYAIEALLKWPQVPALYVVHDATAWHDALPPTESLDAIVAVDERCAARASQEAAGGVVQIIPNPISTERIPLRSRSSKPRSLLIYGKSGSKESWNRQLRLAALTCGIWNFKVLQDSQNPYDELSRYDIIMARARCAMEATLSGAYTIPFDRGLCGGPVTTANVETYLRWNLGMGVMNEVLTSKRFRELVRGYSHEDALATANLLRSRVNPAAIAERFEALYRQCITVRSQKNGVSPMLEDKLRFMRTLANSMSITGESFPTSRNFWK